jgi:hypothetical protein
MFPHVSIDCAIFGYHEESKNPVNKNKFINGWCLWWIYQTNGDFGKAANRIVKERTGIGNLFYSSSNVW